MSSYSQNRKVFKNGNMVSAVSMGVEQVHVFATSRPQRYSNHICMCRVESAEGVLRHLMKAALLVTLAILLSISQE